MSVREHDDLESVSRPTAATWSCRPTGGAGQPVASCRTSPAAPRGRAPSRLTRGAYLLVVGGLLSLGSAASGFGQAPTGGDASRVYSSTAPAVFLIEVRNASGEVVGIGSGFLIDGGRIVTNAHVVEGGQPHLRTGVVALPLSIDRLDPDVDLAVLRADAPIEARPLRLAAAEPDIGTTVFVLGNPRGLERTISEGLLSGRRRLEGRELLQMTAAISPGSSGGPVVDAAGQVVGITVGSFTKGQSLNFAVPVSALRRLLEGGSRTGFAAALARARSLAEADAPDYTDTAAWNRHWRAVRAALDHAAMLASNGPDYLALASVAQEASESERTLRFAQAALRAGVPDPDSARILMTEAWFWDVLLPDSTQTTGVLQRYLAVADTLIASRPARVRSHVFRARVLARLPGRTREALAAARRAIEVARQNGEDATYAWSSLHSLSSQVGTAGDDDEAFEGMVRSGLARAWDWRSHARHLDQREQWSAAARAYLEAYRLGGRRDPDNACEAGASFRLGDMHDEALEAFRACINGYALAARVDTANLVYAHRAIASILESRGVYSSAESHARQALALDPTDAWAALALAEALNGLERYSEAARAAEEAIRLSDGRYASMHFAAGSAYFELGEWSRCERAFRKAAELAPSETSAPYNAALCLARQGYYRDAARWMEEVLTRNPQHRDRADIQRMIQQWRGR